MACSELLAASSCFRHDYTRRSRSHYAASSSNHRTNKLSHRQAKHKRMSKEEGHRGWANKEGGGNWGKEEVFHLSPADLSVKKQCVCLCFSTRSHWLNIDQAHWAFSLTTTQYLILSYRCHYVYLPTPNTSAKSPLQSLSLCLQILS